MLAGRRPFENETRSRSSPCTCRTRRRASATSARGRRAAAARAGDHAGAGEVARAPLRHRDRVPAGARRGRGVAPSRGRRSGAAPRCRAPLAGPAGRLAGGARAGGSAARARRRRRCWWAASSPSRRWAVDAAALVAAPPKPAPATPDMADRYKKVEAWLEDGNIASARRALEQALAERPKDGRVRYMLGRVAFAEDHTPRRSAHYREAITLDTGFRGDPVLLSHVDTMLGEPEQCRRRPGSRDREDRRARGRSPGEDRQRRHGPHAAAARRRRARRHRRGQARRSGGDVDPRAQEVHQLRGEEGAGREAEGAGRHAARCLRCARCAAAAWDRCASAAPTRAA